MLQTPRLYYSVFDTGRILRLSYHHVRRMIDRGELPARKQPNGHFWQVHRDDIYKYMVRNKYPTEMTRGPFGPTNRATTIGGMDQGVLLWLGPPRDLDWPTLTKYCDPVYCRSAYKLGKMVSFTPTWGILIDLTTFKGGLALAKEIAQDKFCPLLIAITEGARQTARAAEVFDLPLPRPLQSTVKFAKELAKFRDSRSIRPRVLCGTAANLKFAEVEA